MTGTINAPQIPSNLPDGTQWLGGEGAGTWFHLSKPMNFSKKEFRIRRYSPEGILECDRIFVLTTESLEEFDIHKPYRFTYLSHCQKCIVLQNEHKYVFLYGSL